MKKSEAKRTSQILEDLRESGGSGKISVGDFTEKVADRAYGLIVFIFGLITGIIPGVSIIFSIPIIIIAVQMILGQHQIWLPKWIAKKTFSESLLKSALKKTIPVLKFLEKFIRPRLDFLTTDLAEKFIAAILIALAVVTFLPLPGFNMVPAAAMCILALGLLERDGLLILLGSLTSIVGIWLMGFVIIKALLKALDYFSDLIS